MLYSFYSESAHRPHIYHGHQARNLTLHLLPPASVMKRFGPPVQAVVHAPVKSPLPCHVSSQDAVCYKEEVSCHHPASLSLLQPALQTVPLPASRPAPQSAPNLHPAFDANNDFLHRALNYVTSPRPTVHVPVAVALDIEPHVTLEHLEGVSCEYTFSTLEMSARLECLSCLLDLSGMAWSHLNLPLDGDELSYLGLSPDLTCPLGADTSSLGTAQLPAQFVHVKTSTLEQVICQNTSGADFTVSALTPLYLQAEGDNHIFALVQDNTSWVQSLLPSSPYLDFLTPPRSSDNQGLAHYVSYTSTHQEQDLLALTIQPLARGQWPAAQLTPALQCYPQQQSQPKAPANQTVSERHLHACPQLGSEQTTQPDPAFSRYDHVPRFRPLTLPKEQCSGHLRGYGQTTSQGGLPQYQTDLRLTFSQLASSHTEPFAVLMRIASHKTSPPPCPTRRPHGYSSLFLDKAHSSTNEALLLGLNPLEYLAMPLSSGSLPLEPLFSLPPF